MYITRPTFDVKCPFASHAQGVDEDLLVDISALARGRCTRERSPSVAITVGLWDRAGRIPFALLGRITLEDRIRHVVSKVDRAVERAHACFGEAFEEAVDLGFAMDFAVGLPRHACDRRYDFARFHCGRGASGELCVTIGETVEFPEPSQWSSASAQECVRR